MNILGAIVAGLAATAVFTMVMMMAPKMDIVGMLGTMFGKENRALGWMMHAMIGIIFGLIYYYSAKCRVKSSRLANFALRRERSAAGWQQTDFSKNGARIRGNCTNFRLKITGRLAYPYPGCCLDEMMDQILEFSKLNLAL